MFVLEIVREKTERVADACEDISTLSKAASVADAEARQAEAGGCNAGEVARVVSFGQSAVLYLARFRAGFIPEKVKGRALNLIQQFFVSSLIRRSSGRDEFLLRICKAAQQRRKRGRKKSEAA